MRLRVFGRNTDDKGTQLEELTRRLLERLGYRQLALNVVGPGGSEIDVRGELPMPGPGSVPLRVIGECKAYEAPITLPDWLKFLGKMYSEDARWPGQVRGLFVALSGANGNVRGAVDEFRARKDIVTLVDGEYLADLTRQEFGLPTLQQVSERIRQLTSDPVAEFSLGYADRNAFWIVLFGNDSFSMALGRNGDGVPSVELVELVRTQIQTRAYRNLQEEDEYRKQLRASRKLILARLVAVLSDVPRAVLLSPEADFVPTEASVEDALVSLVREGLVQATAEGFSVGHLVNDLEMRLQVLRELTDAATFISVLSSSGWLSLVDDDLLDAILKLQGLLPLPLASRSECLSLLRWSPSGLAWAIRPDAMLLGHRSEATPHSGTHEQREVFDANDVRYFRLQLLRRALNDFMIGPLAEHYFEKLDLREVEVLRRAKFKSSTRVELEVEVTERLGVYRLAPDTGSGVAKVWLHETAPEPWGMHAPTGKQDPPSPDPVD